MGGKLWRLMQYKVLPGWRSIVNIWRRDNTMQTTEGPLRFSGSLVAPRLKTSDVPDMNSVQYNGI